MHKLRLKLKNNAEIDDENESFHSVNMQSVQDSFDLDNLSSIKDEDSPSVSPDFMLENVKNPKLRTVSRATEQDDLHSPTRNALVKKLSQHQMPKMSPLRAPLTKCHYEVEQLVSNSQLMPDMELFNMNVDSKKHRDPLDTSPNTEAMQKLAFTEIWLERQQTYPESQRSHENEFTADLDNYFEKNIDHFEKLTLQEQKKGVVNKQLFVEPVKSSNPLTTIAETEPYVSPFEDMPMMPEDKKIPGIKSYITVPAGFDLTNLIEYKNPNHWHRRPTTRNDSHP